MKLLGKPYIIQHFLNYIRAENREKLYKTYVTDMLKHILFNINGGEERVSVDKRWIELAEKSPKQKKEEKHEETQEEVVARIRQKLSKM